MTKTYLTETKKRIYLPKCIEDQGGFICYQCDDILKPGHYVFEHLNDDREDSRYENTGLACTSCNNKKPHNFDMGLKAMELLHKKEEACLKYLEDENAHQNNSSEIKNRPEYNSKSDFVAQAVEEKLEKLKAEENANAFAYIR